MLGKTATPSQLSDRDARRRRGVLGAQLDGGRLPVACVSAFTLKHKEWVRELLTLILADPSIPKSFTFSSIHINFNTVAAGHQDSNACRESLIAAFGDFTKGGEFWVETDTSDVDMCDIHNAWWSICGQRRHGSTPFAGNRFSVILFAHQILDRAPLDLLKTIDELGFRRVAQSDSTACTEVDLQPGNAVAKVDLRPENAVTTSTTEWASRAPLTSLSRGQGGLAPTQADAKERPGSWATFRAARHFWFVHHFAGPEEFNLGEAIVAEARSRGLRADHVAVDKKRDGQDLLASEPYSSHSRWAAEHWIDGHHSGWCCATFSPLRAKKRRFKGMKGPVRSAEFPRGLPSNTEAEQQEADRGTSMAVRSADLAAEVADSAILRTLLPVTTLENPGPPDWGVNRPSAFFLEELVEWASRPGTVDAEVYLCGHGAIDDAGSPIQGRGRWSGTDLGLANTCECTVPHSSLMNPENARRKAAYPRGLCLKYAKHTVDRWERNLETEWRILSSGRATRLASEHGSLVGPAAWAAWEIALPSTKSATKRPGKDSNLPLKKVGRFGNCLTVAAVTPTGGLSYASPEVTNANLANSAKNVRDIENRQCVGGMRSPVWAVNRNHGLKAVGGHVRGIFSSWLTLNPSAWLVATNYGRVDYEGPPDELVLSFRAALAQGIGAEPHEVGTWNYDQHHFRFGVRTPGSAIQGSIIDSWLKCANDPDDQIGVWQRQGVPLGTEVDIVSRDIFPTISGEDTEFELTTVLDAIEANFKNYNSIYDEIEEATFELERYLKEGFLGRVSASDALVRFPDGTVHKKAIILKILDDGSLKRRLFLDCRRSGGNSRQRCPERPVLPRGVEVKADTKALFKRNMTSGRHSLCTDGSFAGELASGDFSDAYPHFCIDERELKHCLSKDPTRLDTLLIWLMLFFGLKVAPLLWSRFAAALGRMLQGTVEDYEARMDIYLDDPLWILWGSNRERSFILVMHLFILLALGVKIAWHKAFRGSQLTRIGISYELLWAEAILRMTVGDKLRDDVLEEASKLLSVQMAGTRRVRKLAGKSNWISGILPRLRWCTNILYAAIRDREICVASGAEAAARAARADPRNKDTLIEVKRFKLALLWLVARLKHNKDNASLSTSASLAEPNPVWDIVLDGSPWGCGGLLVHRQTNEIVECFESALSTRSCRDETSKFRCLVGAQDPYGRTHPPFPSRMRAVDALIYGR